MFFFLLVVIHSIPFSLIQKNIINSSKILYVEGSYRYVLPINSNCIKLDNWTTANTYGNMWNELNFNLKDIVEVKAPSYFGTEEPTEIL